MMGKNRALPCGTVTVRVTGPVVVVPARNQTGPCWPTPAKAPLVSLSGLMSAGMDSAQVHQSAAHWP